MKRHRFAKREGQVYERCVDCGLVRKRRAPSASGYFYLCRPLGEKIGSTKGKWRFSNPPCVVGGGTEAVAVGRKSPVWNGFEDDDWNGATFRQWLNFVPGNHVVLEAPPGYDKEKLVRFIGVLVHAGARRIDMTP